MAVRLGYTNFSEFVCMLLNSLTERYDTEEWESHLVYVADAKVVGFGVPDPSAIPFATSAFQVVGPGQWWRHLERSLQTSVPSAGASVDDVEGIGCVDDTEDTDDWDHVEVPGGAPVTGEIVDDFPLVDDSPVADDPDPSVVRPG